MCHPAVPVPYGMVASTFRRHRAAAVISVVGPEDGYTAVFPARVPVLRLAFSDIHCGTMWSDDHVAIALESGLIAPAIEHVQQALQFARAYPDAPVVVHCHAGASRSPALALAIIADRFGSGREREAVAALFGLNGSYLPTGTGPRGTASITQAAKPWR